MNEILLKEIEVADAYCESAISNAWFEACMMYTESEASDRLKDAKAGILETIGYIIDSMIAAIQEFFEMIRDKIDDIVYGISGVAESIPKLSPKYRWILRECEKTYAEYLKKLESIVDDDIKIMRKRVKSYKTPTEAVKLREQYISRIQKCVSKAVSMKSSTVDMLTDDMFDRLEGMAVQFQRKLHVKTNIQNNKVIEIDTRVIKIASSEAANMSKSITREIMRAI